MVGVSLKISRRSAVVLGGAIVALAIPSSGMAQYAPTIGQDQVEQFRQDLDMRQRDERVKAVDGKKYNLSGAENKAIRTLQVAVEKQQREEGLAALAAAKKVAKGKDAHLLIASLQLQLGMQVNDTGMQSQAVDTMLASGMVPETQLPALYRNQGSLAVAAGDLAKAEAAYTKLVEITPRDPEAYAMLAQTENEARKPAEALSSLEKAIALKAAANEEVPASWKQAAQLMGDNLKRSGAQ